MLKVFCVAFCVLICVLIAREYSRVFAMIISFAGIIICVALTLDKLLEVSNKLENIMNFVSSSQDYIILMLKVLCVVIVAQIMSQLCKDNGENALSTITELSAKIVVVIMIMPLFETIITLLNGIIK